MMNYSDNEIKMIEEKMERVTKGLKAHGYTDCNYCPYWGTGPHRSSECKQLARDALSLLDAQKQEIKDLKQEIEGHKDNLRETFDEMMRYADELKVQELVKPIVDIDTWTCGNCGHILEYQKLLGDNVLLHEQYDYCPMCGKKVKWE